MRSMTGFGRAEGRVGSQQFIVEIKSVNHRFLDTRFRLPSSLNLFESSFAEKLRKHFERGSFDVTIRHRLAPQGGVVATGTKYALDEPALASFLDAVRHLKQKSGISSDPTLESVLATNRVLIPVEELENPESLLEPVKAIFDQAAQQVMEMRKMEGTKLKTVFKEGIKDLVDKVKELEKLAPEQPKRVQEKLRGRIAQWGMGSPIDPQRLEWEVALYAEKSDVSEELVRLNAHAKAFLELLESSASVGRRLDFLSQELNREINTLSSKASILEMTQLAVEIKTSIEKLREQVQNVE
jgi:uncharacterized protein (TIGR00255 family)